MAYISTEHGVGDIVFAYDAESDSVQRLRITRVHARSCDASRYNSGEWTVDYEAAPAQASEGSSPRLYAAALLHRRPIDAFPEIVLECAPAIEHTEAA